MSDLVSEDDLSRARSDPAFRQQMLANNLEILLQALNRMRRDNSPTPQAAAQIREGVDLAVELADRLQAAHSSDPQAA